MGSGGSSLALCGVELRSPDIAWTAVRSRACGVCRSSSLSTVAHSSTYSRCRRRIRRRAGSGTLASSLVCTVIRSGWLSAKPMCQRSSASSATSAAAAATARLLQPLADLELHLREDGVLAREVPVDARPGHPDGSPDVVDGYTVEAALREQPGRGGHDLRTAQCTARPLRAVRAWYHLALNCHVLDVTG